MPAHLPSRLIDGGQYFALRADPDLPAFDAGKSRKLEDFQMKGFIAAFIAVGVLWVVDVEMNGGRYGNVVKNGSDEVLPR
jgi:hypothetical protein